MNLVSRAYKLKMDFCDLSLILREQVSNYIEYYYVFFLTIT